MRLFYAPASPFVAKVRMAAAHCGIALTVIPTDTGAEPAELLAVNPLGKIPTLIAEDGAALYDSAVICDYFDRLSGHKLVPQGGHDWLLVKRIAATADGVADGALLTVYEARMRPEERRHQPWVDRQLGKAWRGMAVLESNIASLGPELTLAHFALAGLLGYLDLRFKGQWEDKHPQLVAWIEAFPEAFPAYEELKPQA